MKVKETLIKSLLENKILTTLTQEELEKIKGGIVHMGSTSGVTQD